MLPVRLDDCPRRRRRFSLRSVLLLTTTIALVQIALASLLFFLPRRHKSPSGVLHRLTTNPSFRPYDSNERFNYQWRTHAKLRWLAACLARGDCPPNADKVIILNTFHCQWALDDGYRGGEGIWCLGMLESWERQGFTVLHGGPVDWPFVYSVYRQIPDLVRVIISDFGEENEHGTFQQYKKSRDRPDGIPAWKFFSVSYYPTGAVTPIGPAWMVTAEPNMTPVTLHEMFTQDGINWIREGLENLDVGIHQGGHFTYLGYPLEPSPGSITVIPPEKRPYRVWLLAKYAHYFHNGHQRAYELEYFERAYHELKDEFPGFEFVCGIVDNRDEEEKERYPFPSVVKNLGALGQTEFDQAIMQSRLMLGLGAPSLSPSPYRALARGVPFANPHNLGDYGRNDQDSTWGYVQHDSLRRVPEPYVYQVEAFSYKSFVDTIRKAMTNPITPFCPLRMKSDVADRRLRDFVLTDWRELAREILEQRLLGNETQHGGDKLEEFLL